MMINKKSISEKAGYYFENGYHCAEAIVAAVLEGMDKDAPKAVAHATAFGGGMGRTFQEACGALSGCLIAIGHFHGRNIPGQSWDVPAQLAANIRQTFLDRFETTSCIKLRERFGEEMQHKECCHIVKTLAADLVDLLQKDLAQS
ncbi:MAG: hypothetical protein A2277_03205 [Desulfobacterales bacterium RIFOXYA12_FULL_46_15]|nr:MAG: hypothetical protein A2277_03205 [Desulfobacterales bacterium RIFOXYA12_FULL_46_15]